MDNIVRAKVSSRGCIVIPAGLRRKHGLTPGTRVNIIDYGGLLAIIPVLSDPIRQGRGLLKGRTRRRLTRALLEEHKAEAMRG